MAVLVVGGLVHGNLRLTIWAAALVFDMAGPLVIDPSGWRLVPAHFAERHGLIVIVAPGESIVAIGVGAQAGVDGGVIGAAVLGIAVASALWWLYFDVSSLSAARRLASLDAVEVRNRMARDGYSYFHLPMVAAIVLVALGMKNTLAHVGDPLPWEPAAALVGGAALYVLGHVAFKLRTLGAFSSHRLIAALVLVAIIPAATNVDAWVTVAAVGAVLWTLIVFEALHYADARREVRSAEHPAS